MRRLWIRLDPDGEGATLHALLHRIPRTRTISLALAHRLAARGVPVVGHR